MSFQHHAPTIRWLARPTVVAGWDHTCAVDHVGNARCWGDGGYGQLGQESRANLGDGPNEMGENLPPINLGTDRTVQKLACGRFHSCALLHGGSVKCWGSNSAGQLGQGSTSQLGDDAGEMGDELPEIDLGSGRTAVDIAAGGSQSCAILDDGTVKCWGNGVGNVPGEMGDALPPMDFGQKVVQMAVGDTAACALLEDMSLKCWGSGSKGQLGQGTSSSISASQAPSFPAVDVGGGVMKVAAGWYHVCAILDNGSMACWGDGSRGQLGSGSTSNIGDQPGEMGENLPVVDVGSGRSVLDISLNGYHSCALLDDFSTKCWGDTTDYSIIYGDAPSEMGDELPVVNLGTNRSARQIASGLWHRCAILDDCSLKCWGAAAYGRLGYEDQVDRYDDRPARMGDNLPTVDVPLTSGSCSDMSFAGTYAHFS